MIRAYRPHLEDVPVESIVVGFRRRQSVGDLTSLVQSIERVGLINPIIITERGRLVIGLRRLEAYRLLRRTTITAHRLPGELSVDQIAEWELEENTLRE